LELTIKVQLEMINERLTKIHIRSHKPKINIDMERHMLTMINQR